MRQSLNENPVVQAVLVGVLVLAVGFLLFTRVFSSGSSSEPATATETSATTDATATPSGTATPSDSTSSTPSDSAAGTVPEAPAGAFAKGPGLPGGVVKAYADGKVVALLVVRQNGIDDKKVKAMVERLRSRGDTAVFVTRAKDIARYSRITQGVDVQRVPALVVLKPRRLTDGDTPVGTVSYGFRGPASVNQAVEDALYKGRADIPYYPE